MSAALQLALVLVCAALSWVVCRWLVRWLHAAAVLDIPNARSLHQTPVPRGGGLAIAAVVVLAQGALLAADLLTPHTGLALIAGGVAFAALGWADDRRDRGAALRLAIQCLLGVAFLAILFEGDFVLRSASNVGIAAALLLALVWHVNLFNFMDGADGFAATEAIMVALGLAFLTAAQPHAGIGLSALAVAGACAGFLYWNRAPARLFLGDSGSYFIGFELAALILAAARHGLALLPMLILLAPFVVDASLTLLLRMLTVRSWWRAHREHAFQRLILQGWSARGLARALAVYLAALCWPAAWLAAHTAHALSVSLIVYGLTAIIWLTIRTTTAAR